MGPPGIAVLFPGQGSQHGGMRAAVHTQAPELLARVSSQLGGDPFSHLDEGTRWVQPAVFLASVAGWYANRDSMPAVAAGAGHSLGELATMVASGMLTAEAGADIVVRRAIITQDVAREVDGGMMALLGVKRDDALRRATEWGLHVANDNCPGQVVLSGTTSALAAAERSAAALEVSFRRIAVDGPFHSPLMAPAAERFATELSTVVFGPGAFPVWSSTNSEPFDDPRRRLADALMQPVRWHDTIRAIANLGVTRFVELPPGKVLIGLVRRILRAERPSLAALDSPS